MIDGFNRFMLLIVGLISAVAGGLGLAVGEGAFDDLDRPATVYDDVRREIVDDPALWLAVVLGGATLVLVLALVWACRQFTSRPGGPHLSTVVLDAGRRGRTTLEPVRLARAIAGDLETIDGVRNAKVRILSTGKEPSMRAQLEVDRLVDPDELLKRTEPALERAARSFDAATVDARIRMDFADRRAARVV
ncbi:MAG: hypothetical protein WD225_06835 [Ilumatobacteraceae bacterium]